MESFIKFQPSVINSLEQELIAGSQRNDNLWSYQVRSNHLNKYVWITALAIMEWYIKFLPLVIKSFVQVCLPKGLG